MRNLSLLYDTSNVPLPLLELGDGAGIVGFCSVSSRGRPLSPSIEVLTAAHYSLSVGGTLSAWNSSGSLLWQELLVLPPPDGDDAAAETTGGAAETDPSPRDLGAVGGSWMHITYLDETETLFLAHSSGVMALRGKKEGAQLESIGDIDAGIEALAWTSDGSVVLVVTGDCNLLTLSATSWDVLAEAPCGQPFIRSSKPASATTVADTETGTVAATWRGDGAYFALNVTDAATRRQMIYIYSSDCTARGVGRNEDGSPVHGLHAGAIAWSADGALIAVGQDVILPSRTRVQIAFFETNGLRHRELLLPGIVPVRDRYADAAVVSSGSGAQPAKAAGAIASAGATPSLSSSSCSSVKGAVKWLSWNADCDVLAILLALTVPSDNTGGGGGGAEEDDATLLYSLQLWHRDNYHWYMKKQQIVASTYKTRENSEGPGGKGSGKSFTSPAAGECNASLLLSSGRTLVEPIPITCHWSRDRSLRLHFISSSEHMMAQHYPSFSSSSSSSSSSSVSSLVAAPPILQGSAPSARVVCLHTWELDWRYDATSDDASGTVAVLDAEGKILLTPFALAGVPPPMSFCSLKLSLFDAGASPSSLVMQRSSAMPSELVLLKTPTVAGAPAATVTRSGAATGDSASLDSEPTSTRVLILTNNGCIFYGPVSFVAPGASPPKLPSLQSPEDALAATSAAPLTQQTTPYSAEICKEVGSAYFGIRTHAPESNAGESKPAYEAPWICDLFSSLQRPVRDSLPLASPPVSATLYSSKSGGGAVSSNSSSSSSSSITDGTNYPDDTVDDTVDWVAAEKSAGAAVNTSQTSEAAAPPSDVLVSPSHRVTVIPREGSLRHLECIQNSILSGSESQSKCPKTTTFVVAFAASSVEYWREANNSSSKSSSVNAPPSAVFPRYSDHLFIAEILAHTRETPVSTSAVPPGSLSSALAWRPPSPGLRIVAVFSSTDVSLERNSADLSGSSSTSAANSFSTTRETSSSTQLLVYVHCSDGSVWRLVAKCDVPLSSAAVSAVDSKQLSKLVLVSARAIFKLPEVVSQWKALDILSTAEASNRTTSPLLISFGAKSCQLYANGYLISGAVASATVSNTHKLLLFLLVGPTPCLAALNLGELVRFVNHKQDLRGSMPASSPPSLTSFQLNPVNENNNSNSSNRSSGSISIESSNTRPRALERGSRLVTALDFNGNGVLLQMPRGNVEAISPRVMCLSAVRNALDTRPVPLWSQALELCRRHRLDMNLLVDHHPQLLLGDQWGLYKAVHQVEAGALSASIGGPTLMRKIASLRGTDRWDLLLSSLDPSSVTSALAPLPAALSKAPVSKDGEEDDGTTEDLVAGKYAPPTYYPGPPPPCITQWAIEAAIQAADPSIARIMSSLDGETSLGEAEGRDECVHFDSREKVNLVCASIRLALLRAMLKQPPTAPKSLENAGDPVQNPINWRTPFVYSVLTSFARQIPPDFNSILRTVQLCAANETAAAAAAAAPPMSSSSSSSGSSPSSSSSSSSSVPIVSVDAALSHAILVTDSNIDILYSAALGMYDIPLAHALAQRGQSDPREYLPLLTKIASLGKRRDDDVDEVDAPPLLAGAAVDGDHFQLTQGALRLRWAVDVHLGRWKLAVKWLAALGLRRVSALTKLHPSAPTHSGEKTGSDSSSSASSSKSSSTVKEERAARLAALLSMKGSAEGNPQTPSEAESASNSSSSASSEKVEKPMPSKPASELPPSSPFSSQIPSESEVRLAMTATQANFGTIFAKQLSSAISSSSGSTRASSFSSSSSASAAADATNKESLIDIGMSLPLLTCIMLACEHKAHAEAINVFEKSNYTSSDSAVAAAPVIISQTRRLLLVDSAWRLAAGMIAVSRPSGGASASFSLDDERLAPSSSSSTERMLHSVPAPAIMYFVEKQAPPSVAAKPLAILTAPSERISDALFCFLHKCDPPAIEDAYALSLLAARADFREEKKSVSSAARLPSNAPNAGSGGAVFPGVPLWKHAMSLAGRLRKQQNTTSLVAVDAKAALGHSTIPSVKVFASELAASIRYSRSATPLLCLHQPQSGYMPTPASLRERAKLKSGSVGDASFGGSLFQMAPSSHLGESSELAAAAELFCGPANEIESGIRCFCDGAMWEEALRACLYSNRNDLAETDVLPSLEAATSEFVEECSHRASRIKDILSSLAKCRRLRSVMSLTDLLGHADAARVESRVALIAAGLRASDEGNLFSGRGERGDDDGFDGGGIGDDGASLSQWSDASSLDSASDAGSHRGGGEEGFRSGGGIGGGASSVASSAASTSSIASHASSGRFSHRPASSLPTTLTNLKSTLRMSQSEMTASEAIAVDTVAANRAISKKDKAMVRKAERGKRANDARLLKVRPGSLAEERQFETELMRLLPLDGGLFWSYALHLVSVNARLGFPAEAGQVSRSFNELVTLLLAARGEDFPPLRRNVTAEVRRLFEAAAASLPLDRCAAIDPSLMKPESILPAIITSASTEIDPVEFWQCKGAFPKIDYR